MRHAVTIALAALSLTLAACGDDAETTPYVDPGPADAPSRADCPEDDFMGAPLAGPSFTDGVYSGPTDTPLVASSTVLYLVDDPEAGARFQALMGDMMGALQSSEGLLGLAMGGSDTCGAYRTLALWRDEAAMWRFVGTDAHIAAMTAAVEIADRGTGTTHWTFDPATDTLDWALGKARTSEADPFK